MLETFQHIWRVLCKPVYTDEYVLRFRTEGYCAVMANGNLEGIADEIILREIQYHQSIGRSFEWTYNSCDKPDDMVERLQKYGFVPEDMEVICAFDLANLQPKISAIRVERVVDESGLADFKAVAEAVFRKDYSYTAGVLQDAIREGSLLETGFVAYEDETPVSIGRLTVPEGSPVGGMYTGGTLSSHRGKGYYRAVVGARMAFAKELGLKAVSVDARPTSLPILRRLGFEPVVESWPCIYEVG